MFRKKLDLRTSTKIFKAAEFAAMSNNNEDNEAKTTTRRGPRTVFLSYARESGAAAKAHEDAVLQLTSFLQTNGVAVRVDITERVDLGILGVGRWTSEALESSDEWLMLVTPTYNAESANVPGERFEFTLMQNAFVRQGCVNKKCIPVVMKALGGRHRHVPATFAPMPCVTYDPEVASTGDDLLGRIFGEYGVTLVPSGSMPTNLTTRL